MLRNNHHGSRHSQGGRRRAAGVLAAASVIAATFGMAADAAASGPADDTPLRIGTLATSAAAFPLNRNGDTYVASAYANLVERDPTDLSIVPGLASSWERPDDVTYNFVIRDDAQFSDGTPITAHDIAFTYNQVIENSYAWLQSVRSVASVEATDDHSLTIVTAYPDPMALAYWSGVPIISQAHLERVGPDGFNADIVTSGPYRVTEFNGDVSIKFEAADTYWAGPPPTEHVELYYFKEPSAIAAAFQSGQLDVAHAMRPESRPTLTNSEFEFLEGYSGGTQMFQMNTTKPPFDNPDLRLAANMAIDQDALVEALTYGTSAIEDGQPVFPGMNGYNPDVHTVEYDLEGAKALVAANADDAAAVIHIQATQSYRDVVEALYGMLTEAGFNVEIQLEEVNLWLDAHRNGSDAEVFFRGASSGNHDAGDLYNWLTWSDKPFVTDQEWVDLWTQISTEMDPETRTTLLQEAGQMVRDNNYVLFTNSSPRLNGWISGISGIVWVGNFIDFSAVTRG